LALSVHQSLHLRAYIAHGSVEVSSSTHFNQSDVIFGREKCRNLKKAYCLVKHLDALKDFFVLVSDYLPLLVKVVLEVLIYSIE
jgi:hypothetical protein